MILLIQRRKFWYAISGTLALLGAVSLIMWGLKFGLDFTGGSLLEVEFTKDRPGVEVVVDGLKPVNIGNIVAQPMADKGMLLRFRDVNEDQHQQILNKLKEIGGGELTEKRFESIGPVVGSELQQRSIWAIVLACFFIISYISWAFRKVSRPVVSWKYGIVAVLALLHDLLITIGVFSILGHFFSIEVDSLFVSALLTILGFSVHDTIVVFDRIRENLFRGAAGDFEIIVNKSVNDTLARSINTSLTTLIVLACLFILGGESIRYFALALLVGITAGTYSSIFVASPLLVDWHKWALKQTGRKS